MIVMRLSGYLAGSCLYARLSVSEEPSSTTIISSAAQLWSQTECSAFIKSPGRALVAMIILKLVTLMAPLERVDESMVCIPGDKPRWGIYGLFHTRLMRLEERNVSPSAKIQWCSLFGKLPMAIFQVRKSGVGRLSHRVVYLASSRRCQAARNWATKCNLLNH